jgi:hypothetical protein
MRNYRLILVALTVLFIAVRIFRLDADVPFERMFMISPVDEAYYVPGAMNLNLYGTYTNNVIAGAERDASTLLFSNSIITACTLYIAGNNYFGLRLSSVLMSVFVLFCFIALRKRYSGNSAHDSVSGIVTLILVSVMIFDPAFLTMSRVQDPVMFRAAWLMAIVLFVFEWIRRGQHHPMVFSYTLGLLSVLSVLIGYVHNAFICAAAGSLVFLLPLLDRKVGRSALQSLLFFGGIASGVALFAFLNSWLTGVSISEMISFMGNASEGRMQADRAGLLQRFAGAFIQTLSSGIFRLNPGVLFLFIIALIFLIRDIFKRKDPADVFVVLLFVWLFAQAFFENTYPEKRHTMLLPLVLLVVGKWMETSLSGRVHSDNKINLGTGLLSLLLTLYVVRGFYKMIVPDYPGSEYLLYTGLVSLFGVAFVVFLRKVKSIRAGFAVIIAGSLLVLPGVYLWSATSVCAPGFTYREGMKQIAGYTQNGILAGGLGIGFHTYSSGKCGINSYAWYHDYPQYIENMEQLVARSTVPVYTVLYPQQSAKSRVKTINSIHKADYFERHGSAIKTDTIASITLSDRSVLLLRLRTED